MIARRDLLGSSSLYHPRWEPEPVMADQVAPTWPQKTAADILADIRRFAADLADLPPSDRYGGEVCIEMPLSDEYDRRWLYEQVWR